MTGQHIRIVEEPPFLAALVARDAKLVVKIMTAVPIFADSITEKVAAAYGLVLEESIAGRKFGQSVSECAQIAVAAATLRHKDLAKFRLFALSHPTPTQPQPTQTNIAATTDTNTAAFKCAFWGRAGWLAANQLPSGILRFCDFGILGWTASTAPASPSFLNRQ